MSGFLDTLLGMPVLRRVSETDQGPHRSATPESKQMQNIETFVPRQQKFVESTVVTITADYARHLRDTAHFERQRKISSDNVKRLAGQMMAGRFIPGLQVYICVLPDGSERIVNGNHTLEAIAACGIAQDVTLTRAAVNDLDEAGRIYAVFDLQKVRSWSDSLKAIGAGDGIPDANRVLSAVALIKGGFAQVVNRKRDRISTIEQIKDYREPAEMLANCVRRAPAQNVQMIKRTPIMAVALETLRYQPSLASDFWTDVAQDDGLQRGRPERALLLWLRSARAGGGKGQREHCNAAALAWNAAFRGDDRGHIRPNAMSEFFLLGTPHASGLGRARKLEVAQ